MAQAPVLEGTATRVKTPNLRWLLITIPLFIINIISMVDKVGISVLISNKPFLQDMNLIGKPAVVGLLMSSFLVSYSICQFGWAYAVKRFGPRICAITGIIIWGVTLFLSGIAHSVGALIWARVILGIGEGVTYPAAHAFVANWFPVKERARATSIWLNGVPIGPAVAGALVVAIVAAGGWRGVFFGLAAISIVIPLPLLIFLMRNKPRQHPWVTEAEIRHIEEGSLAKTKEVPKKGNQAFLRNYRFWLLAVGWGCSAFFFWGWTTWMPTYFRTAHHFSFQAAGYLYSLTFAFAALTNLAMGYFSNRHMRRAPFCTGLCIIAGVMMYIGGNVISDPYRAFGVLIIALCAQQPALLMIHTLLHSIVPEGSVGAASGVGSAVASFMAMASPAIGGFLLQVSGFGAVVAALSISIVLAGFCISFLAKQGY